MKKIIVLIAVAAMTMMSGSKVSAQSTGKYGHGADSVECVKYLSFYSEYYKQKNYESALPNWRKAYKHCPPSARYSMLSDGSTLIRNLIQKNKNNPIYKAQLLDSLMTLYDQRVEYFPKYAISSLNNKAIDLYNYLKDEPSKLLDELTSVISVTKEQTKPDVFLYQMLTAVDLYKIGLMDADSIIEMYDDAVNNLSIMTPKNEKEKEKIASVLENLEILFISSNVASCDNLLALFTPKLEANPEDVTLAKKIVTILSKAEDCLENDLYLSAINIMHNVEPSSTSAYYLYRLYSDRSEYDTAVKFLEESISYEDSDDLTDGDYYYQLALYHMQNNQILKAYEAARKAAELNPEFAGRAYMMMGTIWANTVCQGNDIERRAPFWVAVDFMVKARNADPSLAADANKNIQKYSTYYPTASDAFMYNFENGQSYVVSCGGLRATTTVKTQN